MGAAITRDYGWQLWYIFILHQRQFLHPHHILSCSSIPISPVLSDSITAAEKKAEAQRHTVHRLRYPVGYLFLNSCLCIGQSQLCVCAFALSSGFCSTNAVNPCFPSSRGDKRFSAILVDRKPLHNNNEPCWRHTEFRHMQNKHAHSRTHSFKLPCECVRARVRPHFLPPRTQT